MTIIRLSSLFSPLCPRGLKTGSRRPQNSVTFYRHQRSESRSQNGQEREWDAGCHDQTKPGETNGAKSQSEYCAASTPETAFRANARHNTSAQIPTAESESLAGVTVIRPLKGVDCHLEENLRASFEQTYPRMQVILCVASEDDPAIGIAQRLIAQYPRVDAELIIGKSINLRVSLGM